MEENELDEKSGNATQADGSTAEKTESSGGASTPDTKELEIVKEARHLASLIESRKKEEAELRRIREEKKALKSGRSQDEQPEAKADEADTLATVDDWKLHIDRKSRKAVEPVLSEFEKLKKAQLEKAKLRFLSTHPEYGQSEEKMDLLMNRYEVLKSRPDSDADLIFEDLEDAWAVLNRKAIQEEAEKIKRAKADADSELAEVAASGGAGTSTTRSQATAPQVKASKSDYASAKIAGMPLDKYLALKQQLEESEI